MPVQARQTDKTFEVKIFDMRNDWQSSSPGHKIQFKEIMGIMIQLYYRNTGGNAKTKQMNPNSLKVSRKKIKGVSLYFI